MANAFAKKLLGMHREYARKLNDTVFRVLWQFQYPGNQ